jgi:2-phosphosulfolactate phosphatase
VNRQVDVIFGPPWPTERVRGTHAVVVDVLRATSTIATALASGSDGVIPVESPEEALLVRDRLGRDRVLLCGERASVTIPGFDLDNSPASFTAAAVAGKTLVMTTTNGTRALRAVGAAVSVRTAAPLNRAAVARALAAQTGDMTIVCAGDDGRFALDDALGAGALVDALLRLIDDLELHDGARAAAMLYAGSRETLRDAIASADHAATLARAGFGTDVVRCAELDQIDVVPTLHDGMLVPR